MAKPLGQERVRWTISLPKDIADSFDALHHNPVLERAQYGCRSEFIEGAIVDFLRKQKRNDGEKVLELFQEQESDK